MKTIRNWIRGKALQLASILILIQFGVVTADMIIPTLFFDEIASVAIALLMGRIIWLLKKTETK